MRTITACGVATCLMLVLWIGHAGANASWLLQRQAQFARWQAAHPDADKRIADLKAKTAALLSRARTQSAGRPLIGTEPMVYRVHLAINNLWDDPVAPQMVVIPAGEFTMGAASSEQNSGEWERPQHRVVIDYPFAVGKYHVTRGEFARFVEETNYDAKGDGCYGFTGSNFEKSAGYNWEDPGFSQTDRDPVVCVNWDDVQAYVSWLTRKTGKPYRLLSESEWEYAARAGTTTAYWWGVNADTGCSSANMADQSAKSKLPNAVIANCNDNYVFTSPAGSFAANAFGLYDMIGNAWQWLADCWNENYTGAPTNGAAWQSGVCSRRVNRGGSWFIDPKYVRSAGRGRDRASDRYANNGFRVARTL
jgi:formylglycine-generating enzyme required for sulfatase activity